MKLDEVIEILVEYSFFDPYSDHTVWISPEGKVWSLKDRSFLDAEDQEEAIRTWSLDKFEQPAVTHGTWIAYNWPRLFNEDYDETKHNPYDYPIEHGWLRIRNQSFEFNINGDFRAAQKQFKKWWPTVMEKLEDRGNMMVYIDKVDSGKRSSLLFKLPADKIKLMQWGKGEIDIKPIGEALSDKDRDRLIKGMFNPLGKPKPKDFSKDEVRKTMDKFKDDPWRKKDQDQERTDEDEEVYQPPKISVGDEVKIGKFKNRKAEVKGFYKDDHGQPVLKTTKGDQKLFKPRISKLEPKKD